MFFANISASLWYFFVKFFLLAKSNTVDVIKIKVLIMGVQITLETILKVPILAVFNRFWKFLELFVLAQGFILGHWFFNDKLVQCIYFHV